MHAQKDEARSYENVSVSKMLQANFLEIFLFIIGFNVGFQMYIYCNRNLSVKIRSSSLVYSDKNQVYYEHELADFLFNEVKVLCFVFTHPANHKTKVPHVRQTWGRGCNKLLFMSIENDPDQPDIIALPVENGRKHLRQKTRLAMKYIYENHFDDADWFLRADDDK